MLSPQATENKISAPSMPSALYHDFHQWFEVVPADTPELRAKAYQLRYQVYCCENQFETPEEHPYCMEKDAFDHRSIHSLILDRVNDTAIATVRLILHEPHSHEADFPIQHVCSHPLPIKPPLSGFAEISRFAISKKMRKAADGDCPKELKCSIVMGLMRAIVQMSFDYGISDWLAVMEPSLLRLLCRFGIYFAPMGSLVDYHGLRQPCHANVDRMLETVRQVNFDLWEFVTELDFERQAEKAC